MEGISTPYEGINMKKITLLLAFSLCFGFSAEAQVENKFAVFFANKGNNPFTLENPSAYLTARAIERRQKQNIEIDSLDLPVTPAYIQAVKSTGAKILNPTKWLNAVTIEADSSVLDSILALSFVDSVRLIFNKNYVEKTSRPHKFDLIDYDEADYGDAFRQIEMMNGHMVHDLEFKGEGMLIGVLDGGFTNAQGVDALKPLFNNNQIVAAWDPVGGDDDPYESSGHGTAVLSCMGGFLKGEIIGTAPLADYILIRTEDVASEFPIEEFNWASGAEYADSLGADILNTSLGYSVFDDSTMSYVYERDLTGDKTWITRASNIAFSRGILVVTSAGNEGGGEWFHITAPGDGIDVLTVGATDDNYNRASFSSFGPDAQGRIKPNVAAMGASVTVAYSFNMVRPGSGTSFSGPILAGMAASFWPMNPDLSALELRELIKSIGHKVSDPDFSVGTGVPDFKQAISNGTSLNPNIFANDDYLVVFPNPTANDVTVEFFNRKKEYLELKVFDATGRLLHVEGHYPTNSSFFETKLLESNNFLPGLYILELQTANKTLTRKINKI